MANVLAAFRNDVGEQLIDDGIALVSLFSTADAARLWEKQNRAQYATLAAVLEATVPYAAVPPDTARLEILVWIEDTDRGGNTREDTIETLCKNLIDPATYAGLAATIATKETPRTVFDDGTNQRTETKIVLYA